MNIPLKADREPIFQQIKVPGLRVAQRQLTPSGYAQFCWYWYSTSLEIWETGLLYQPMQFQHSLGIMHGELSGRKTLSIWVKPTVTANTGGHIHILVNTVGHIHFPFNTEGYIHLAATAGRHIHITTHAEGHINIPAYTGVHIRILATVGVHTREIANISVNRGSHTHVTVNTHIVANTRSRAHLNTKEGGSRLHHG